MKTSRILFFCTLVSAASLSLTVQASMITEGQSLHEKNCVSCHQSDIYTRDNRKVNTLSYLGTSVENCNTQLGTGWFPEDVQAVVKYLNATYYKLK
jgi:mono/diheme cytochrome c family protein